MSAYGQRERSPLLLAKLAVPILNGRIASTTISTSQLKDVYINASNLALVSRHFQRRLQAKLLLKKESCRRQLGLQQRHFVCIKSISPIPREIHIHRTFCDSLIQCLPRCSPVRECI